MMIKSKNSWLLAVPTAFLALAGCGGGGNGPTPAPTATPIPTIPTLPTGVDYNNQGTYSAIVSSNVDNSRFVANQSGVLRSDSDSAVLTLTDQDSIIQSRRFRITGPFTTSTVGQTFPLASIGGPGVATVAYEQNDGGTLSRWQATGGSVTLDQFLPSNTVGVDATVRFRLTNATFVPAANADKGNATGTFTFNVNGAIN